MKNLLVAVPQLEIHRPPVSTALLAGIMHGASYQVSCLDLNIQMYHDWGEREYYSYVDVWEKTREPTFEEKSNIKQFILKELIPHCDNNTRVLISVFTVNSQIFTKLACQLIQADYPHCEIILGGTGCNHGFGPYMLEEKLCNHVIYGEGELALLNLLEGNTDYPGVDNETTQVQVNDLNTESFPDYTDVNFDKYEYLYTNRREVNIVGSRGCVRKCTYCNVAALWPKFRYRSGQNIADEMINYYEKHGVSQFYFTDSLINGSLKAFRDMCDKLANYNQTHKAGFKWGGQFIFKQKKTVTDDYFDMIAQAGGDQFYVGVETGSDKIRWEMDKKFTNEDIDYHLEQFRRVGLRCFFLMIIGYHTETLQDHKDNLDMYSRWQKYVATETISGIDLSTSLMFLPDTPLERMIDSHGIVFPTMQFEPDGTLKPNRLVWTSKSNPELTFEERIRRRLEVHDVAMSYKWPIHRGTQRLESIKGHVEAYKFGKTRVIPIKNLN